ncbi:SusC/RagA family TonB-linked outer membrane protein [Confluentibacter sediminis]|uniref:SusC/RagA family TonB-linked outer membrane protein n=1 Tax=Confluentibacter sediminis TaxID=2219045 RepID=UPI0013A6C322|nr:SusC/RagA family TonB-linked outer membrane protein [Confluentibacter sediminis]
MKLLSLFAIVSMFSVQAKSFSQDQKITLNVNNVLIQDVFNEIESMSEIRFLYNNSKLDAVKRVTINVKDQYVSEVLKTLLAGTDIEFVIKKKYIILKSSENKFEQQNNLIQNSVKGIVSSSIDGLPLPGVTILVKGTNIGTQTGFDGDYSIAASPGETLVFSYIGFKSIEKTVPSNSVLNVSMEEDVSSLDEVIVTGYQKISRKLFTGSASTIKLQDVKLDGVPDVSRALQGQVAGVEIENVSGTFGTSPAIRIRGNSSINGLNKPLWVIDGVILENAVDLSNTDITSGNLETILSSSTAGINPEDVESFEVLKDASATALYGARALDGVIVITTKRGKTGKPSINFTSSLSVKSKPTYNQFNFLNSGNEMSVYQELYEKGWIDIAGANTARNHGVFSDMLYKIANNELNWGPGGSPNYAYLQRYADANTDWFDVLFKESFARTNSFSISSGTETSRYRASISSLVDEGQTIADNVKNYTANLNADFDLSKDFTLGFKITGNVRDQKVAASENRKFNAITGVYERNFDINPFNYALYTSRSITPYDENGDLQFLRRNYAPFNIIHEVAHNYVDLDLMDLSFQTNLNWKLTNNLNFTTVLQGRWYESNALQTIHENSNNAEAYRADNPLIAGSNIFLFDDPDAPELLPYSVLPTGGFRKTTKNSLTNYYMRNQFDYSKVFSDVHTVSALLAQEITYSNRSYEKYDGWGYLFDKGGLVISDPNFIRFLDSRGEDYFGVNDTRARGWGVFTNLAYAYKSKYIINGTYTYTGDNRTGNSKAARYLPTWNISGAWNIHQESFMDNVDWVNQLRIKSTYGLSGKNPYDASAGLILYGAEPLRPDASEREVALLIDQLENSELTFEKLYEWNIGLETYLFNNRLGVELEYYKRTSEDLIGYVETNGVGGEGTKLGNIGTLKRDGYEITLRTVNLVSNDFKWSSNFNFSHSTSKITQWESQDRIGDAISRNGGNIIGYSAGSLFSVPFAGLDSNGIPTFYGEDGEIIYSLNLQDREDITKHLKYEGPTEPTFFGGFNNTISYKNLSFDFGFSYRGGNKIRLDDAYKSTYDDYNSLPGDLINRWSLPGDENITNIPAILSETVSNSLDAAGSNAYELYNKSDLRVADGDFVRLKNIKLTYRMPESFIRNTWLKSASMSLSAYNLWLLYSDDKLNGIDPEFFQTGGVSLPLTRSYTFTLNFNF